MTESAQVFQGVHDTPVYTNFLGKPLRLWVAITAATGLTATALATVLLLDSGHARAVFVWGLLATAALAGAGALMPRTRPNAAFRLRAWRRAARPRLHSSATDAHLAPPPDTIANLTFTSHGVYAHFVLTGLRYYLQPTKRRIGVAESHRSLARELPSGTWLYGLSVPQDQRQLLRAMLHGHRDKPAWIQACQQMHPHLAQAKPRTRIYWLAIPVDAGRGGHSPTGQITKVKDWLAGRDKDSDSSLAAYHRLAQDIITALPEEFTAMPVSEDMIDWFWRHNAFRGSFTDPLPRRHCGARMAGSQLPAAVFDEGDQAHRPHRPWALRWVPSWKKALRISSPDGRHPDSYQAVLPVTDTPKQGIRFPGSEFLAALDDLETGATFDFAINLVMRNKEMEAVRNDRAKENIDDQFEQRQDVRNGDAELRATRRQLAEYERLLTTSADERPLEAAFLIAVGAPDEHTLDYSIKRLREELASCGPIGVRYYRGAQTRLWTAFNPGAANHKTGVDQFSYATTTAKWSRFVPIVSIRGRQRQRNPVGIQPKQRPQQRSAHRPARNRAAQPQPLPGVRRRPRLRKILRRQTHRARRDPARRTGIHHRPRHRRMGRRPGRHPQHSRDRHGGQPLRLRPPAHLPRPCRRQLLAGLHGAHDAPRHPQHRRGPAAHPADRPGPPPRSASPAPPR